ncbi:hypothetical protein GH714_037325 [Hevea brasiliensis]|uniref:RNase H type-1 domain-containing protein n=1 Tax=Hevea brasiliensis TaxID=3981 RepID=A0A6A6LTA5_HEVBR|nr:hypothetical protein GH714_037325 [Hevea brasiliensis]
MEGFLSRGADGTFLGEADRATKKVKHREEHRDFVPGHVFFRDKVVYGAEIKVEGDENGVFENVVIGEKDITIMKKVFCSFKQALKEGYGGKVSENAQMETKGQEGGFGPWIVVTYRAKRNQVRHDTVVPPTRSDLGPDEVYWVGSSSVRGGSKLAYGGGLIRNELGLWQWGFMGSFGQCLVLEVELWAVLQGLKLAWCLGFRKLHLECDNQLVVRILKECNEPGSARTIVLHILKLLSLD